MNAILNIIVPVFGTVAVGWVLARSKLLTPEGLRGLPYLGEAWASYAAPYASKVTAAPDDAARFLAFVKFVNQAIERIRLMVEGANRAIAHVGERRGERR